MPTPPLNIESRPEQQPDADNVSIISGRGMPGKPTADQVIVSTKATTAQDPGGAVFAVYTGTGRIIESELPMATVTVAGAGIESYRSLVSSLQSSVNVGVGSQTANIFTDIENFNPISVQIGRNVSETTWNMSSEFAGKMGPVMHRHMRYRATDANGNTNWLFTGIVPDRSFTLQVAAHRNSVTAYDYGFFLSRQRIPYTETTMNLQGDYSSWDQWITHLLEGTKILPYKINPCSAEDKEFSFTPSTTKMEAIQQISEYANFVFYVHWINTGTDIEPVLQSVAYFVHQDDIDNSLNGLDLPDPRTVTITDPTLIDIPQIKTIIEDSYNRVIVRGHDGSGNWFVATGETDAVTAGEEVAREYYEESSNWNTQAKTDSRASELLAYFTSDRSRVRATFIKRHDLRLWQKIRFEGEAFPDLLTSMGWLRIIDIRHNIKNVDETVTIEVIPDSDIDMQWIERSNTDNVTETEQIVDYKLQRQPVAQIGTVTAIDGNIATVETERGDIIKARIVE